MWHYCGNAIAIMCVATVLHAILHEFLSIDDITCICNQANKVLPTSTAVRQPTVVVIAEIPSVRVFVSIPIYANP